MAKTPSNVVNALKFLMQPSSHQPGAVCAITGDDAFLRHEVRTTLAGELSSSDSEGLEIETLDGRTAELRDVIDALRERSLFGSGRRVVVVEEADALVKRYREKIEHYLEKPAADAVLILEVKTWPANTRLAKAVVKSGLTIRCQVPQQGRELTEFTKQLKDWLVQVAQTQAEVELDRQAVDLLLEQLPTEPGILCQEILKLALLVDEKNKIDSALVRDHVGSWRTRKTWDMIDAAAEGRAADAIGQLHRLLAAGEEPHALLPQMASTFRRFAAAVRVVEQAESQGRRVSLRMALEQSGMPPFKLSAAEGQLRQIGRPRAKQLYEWLLAADLQLKGYNSPKDRARRVLETLIVRLAKQAALEHQPN
ncbi:MAG: DNA polymerase III subunit delta [Planctomycetes bacterium]|nr:DNA polymerase III subunit delta [Planctomycetota bacterium]